MDLVATGSGQTLAGGVYDAVTGKPLAGVRIQNLPLSTGQGAGSPVYSGATGTFSYLTANSARYLACSVAGYEPANVYRATGAASNLRIELQPKPVTELKIDAPAAASVKRGEVIDFSFIINEDAPLTNLVWSISNPLYATVSPEGTVTALNRAGTVILTITDPVGGISHSVLLRIT